MKLPTSLIDLGARAMTLLPPESAHNLTLKLISANLATQNTLPENPRLAVNLAGLDFPNPLGLAAGFDKNAVAINPLLNLGFGFVEVGAVTPQPQSGNDRPRVFRLRQDMAVINRYGFNNDGMEAIKSRLQTRHKTGIVGINLGANKTAQDRIEDYCIGIKSLAGLVDFYTVNISSPNTPGLRALQDKASLTALLERVITTRNAAKNTTPIFLKIAPDLTDHDKTDIVEIVQSFNMDGLIISNTTITRPDTLTASHKDQAGGLSGSPLFDISTKLLGEFYQELGNKIPLIGVGGIASPRDAYKKILAGATLIQLYTALIYQGPSLVAEIIKELPDYLDADGFSTINDAVGAQFR